MKSLKRALTLTLTLMILSVCLPSAQQQKEQKPQRSVGQLEAAIKRQPKNPDLYVALGLAYWDRNDYPRALKAFEQAVKVGPRSAEAHNWLGVARSEKADLPGAIAAFRKAVALNPAYGRAFTNLGSALMKSGDVTEAVTVFQQALSLEPNSLAAHLNLGMALREQGDLDIALTHLRPVAAADPNNAGIQYELGQTLRQSGDLAGAVASFERALEIDPELREGYYGLGLALKQQSAARQPAAANANPGDIGDAAIAIAKGDLPGARDQLTAALRRNDDNARAHNLLGYVLGQQGDPAAALVHLERAVALQPTLADAHYNLGAALWFSGSQAKAVPELRESVKLDPAAGAAYAFLGMALRATRDLAGSRANLQRAIALLPPTPAVYIDLGITFARLGQPAFALGQFEAGLNLPSSPASSSTPDWQGAVAALRASKAEDAEAHHVLGLLLGRQGASSDDVAREFREAIRIKPDFAAAHNHLGLVLIQADDDEGGIAALREAVRIQPDYAEAHANLGAALTPTDVDAAIRELERAVALAPTSVNALYNLAIAYGTSPTHGPAKEIERLRQVISLAPTFARAHLALGKALLQQGQVADATNALQEAVRLEPTSGEAQYQLGLAFARAGRKEEATTALQKGRELVVAADRAQLAALDAAERAPALDDAAQMAEAEGYIRDQKFKDVEPLLTDYVAKHPKSSWGWYALGYSQFAQQKIGESIKSLSTSLALDLHNAEAHKILGRNLMIIGRFDAARIEFEEGLRSKPDSAELHYNLGKLYSIQDNWESARTAFDAAVRIDPQYVEALDGLGFALEALGDDEGAVAQYTKAVAITQERHGSFAGSHVNLSAYYNRVGDAEKALAYADQAIALDPKSDRAWFQRAKAEERQSRLAEAVGSLNTAISYNSRASSYYYVLAGLYRRLGRTDDSRVALDMFQKLDRESADLDKKRRDAARTETVPPGRDRE